MLQSRLCHFQKDEAEISRFLMLEVFRNVTTWHRICMMGHSESSLSISRWELGRKGRWMKVCGGCVQGVALRQSNLDLLSPVEPVSCRSH